MYSCPIIKHTYGEKSKSVDQDRERTHKNLQSDQAEKVSNHQGYDGEGGEKARLVHWRWRQQMSAA
jgi:hypothetical protein